SIIIKSGYDHHDETVEVKYPCLITVDKGVNVPRLPRYRRKLMMDSYKINMVSLKDLKDQNPDHYGLNGSPTQVDEIFPPIKRTEAVQLKGTSKELSKQLFDILKESKFI
ncbi:MAG TPA: electron transfer flavoprotein subunit beta, partial [Acholeplasmataceae bacterium]|nr:electron transfer flavoprotein subunit beta [Acholeplasmataceae bacterium]